MAINGGIASEFKIETERLLLRPCRESDLTPFAEMSADPLVMEYFPAVLNLDESIATMERIKDHFNQHGLRLQKRRA